MGESGFSSTVILSTPVVSSINNFHPSADLYESADSSGTVSVAEVYCAAENAFSGIEGGVAQSDVTLSRFDGVSFERKAYAPIEGGVTPFCDVTGFVTVDTGLALSDIDFNLVFSKAEFPIDLTVGPNVTDSMEMFPLAKLSGIEVTPFIKCQCLYVGIA